MSIALWVAAILIGAVLGSALTMIVFDAFHNTSGLVDDAVAKVKRR